MDVIISAPPAKTLVIRASLGSGIRYRLRLEYVPPPTIKQPTEKPKVISVEVSEKSVEAEVWGESHEKLSRNGKYRIRPLQICLGKALRRGPPKPIPKKGRKLEVSARSKTLYQLLQKPIDIERLGRFIEHCEDCKRSFLRGFFDSEGSVNKGNGVITCFNTNTRLLKYVQRLLRF
jgi:hypothetical protein